MSKVLYESTFAWTSSDKGGDDVNAAVALLKSLVANNPGYTGPDRKMIADIEQWEDGRTTLSVKVVSREEDPPKKEMTRKQENIRVAIIIAAIMIILTWAAFG